MFLVCVCSSPALRAQTANDVSEGILNRTGTNTLGATGSLEKKGRIDLQKNTLKKELIVPVVQKKRDVQRKMGTQREQFVNHDASVQEAAKKAKAANSQGPKKRAAANHDLSTAAKSAAVRWDSTKEAANLRAQLKAAE